MAMGVPNNQPPDQPSQNFQPDTIIPPDLLNNDEIYHPPNDDVYRQGALIDDHSFYNRPRNQATNQAPLINDLAFGFPVKESVSSVAKGVGKLFSRGWSKIPQSFKGVSPGGEEFTSKLDKDLAGHSRPNFVKGTFNEVRQSAPRNKPCVLYLSG